MLLAFEQLVSRAGLHTWSGAFHGFDGMAPESHPGPLGRQTIEPSCVGSSVSSNGEMVLHEEAFDMYLQCLLVRSALVFRSGKAVSATHWGG